MYYDQNGLKPDE